LDGHRFDRLTQSLATGVSRRGLLRGAGGTLGLATAARLGTARAATAKQALCHQTGDPAKPWVIVEVSGKALNDHLAHGDTPYVDCCGNADCGQGSTCCAGQCAVYPLSCGTDVCTWEEFCNTCSGTSGYCNPELADGCQPRVSCNYPNEYCFGLGSCSPADGTCTCMVPGASGHSCETFDPPPGSVPCVGYGSVSVQFPHIQRCCVRFD
jgi:hypothetical protein